MKILRIDYIIKINIHYYPIKITGKTGDINIFKIEYKHKIKNY